MKSFLVKDELYSKLISPHCNLQSGPWVAGGSVRKVWQGRSWHKQDIDFFCNGATQFSQLKHDIERIGKITNVYKTNNAHTYTISLTHGRDSSIFDVFAIEPNENETNREIKIQLICKRWYNSAVHVINEFDFTVAQFVTDGFTILTTPQAIEDCKTNKINLNPNHTNSVSLRRIIKYSAYGFEIPLDMFKNTISADGKVTISNDEY